MPTETKTRPNDKRRPRIVFFGHFGAGNFGNEATLQAMLWNVRRFIPDADMACVTTFPGKVTEEYGVATIPVSDVVVKSWDLRNPLAKVARKFFVGIPSEVFRWFKAVRALWHADIFVVVGTGLLTDSFCLGGWGPYSVFKWSVAAKLSRCRLLFVSAGAGPLDTAIGRALIKSALSLADFRSFRDQATLEYLRGIGFERQADRVFPDLAFSLPAPAVPRALARHNRHPVVGLGLMEFGGLYGVEKTTRGQYSAYIEALIGFVRWLIDRGYDIRLLIGDISDEPSVDDFKSRLSESSIPMDRVIAERVTSTENLLSQIDATDFVVATRFHNVLLSLFLGKPAIAISFHHKCSSLMSHMGLSEYCQDIQKLSFDKLAEQFYQMEKNADTLRLAIGIKVAECRKTLDEQYYLFLNRSFKASAEPLDQETEREFEQVAPGHDRP
jgi:polysaccharide pyruvyl transferase WcaK-like protein